MADLLFDWLGFSCFACVELDRDLPVWLNPHQSNGRSVVRREFSLVITFTTAEMSVSKRCLASARIFEWNKKVFLKFLNDHNFLMQKRSQNWPKIRRKRRRRRIAERERFSEWAKELTTHPHRKRHSHSTRLREYLNENVYRSASEESEKDEKGKVRTRSEKSATKK